MIRLPLILLIVSLICSCDDNQIQQVNDAEKPVAENYSPKEDSVLVQKVDNSKNSIPKNDSLPENLKKLCDQLYEKVILGYDSPNIHITNDGIHKLDMEGHINKLKSLNLFTTDFLERENMKFSECRNTLDSLKLKKEDIIIEGIEYMGLEGCGFLDYIFYLQSQERPDLYTINNSLILENKIEVEIHFYNKFENGYENWDQLIYLHVRIILDDNNEWKIDDIIKKI